MNSRIKKIFENYMKERGFDESLQGYQNEWKKRFERGIEWLYSDYSGRRTLQKIAPDIYPQDIDEFFERQ